LNEVKVEGLNQTIDDEISFKAVLIRPRADSYYLNSSTVIDSTKK